jgi:hypothetical protein
LEQAAADCDAIVHLAAVSGRSACERDPERARAVNEEGTEEDKPALGWPGFSQLATRDLFRILR